MSKNDVLALEANFDAWQKMRAPGLTKVDPFEFYCADQFLRQYGVSDEEIISGLIGGGDDGGSDGAYFFVNRKLVQEDSDLDPKSSVWVNLVILQAKHKAGFSPVAVNKLTAFSDDLLDLSRAPAVYTQTYNTRALEMMALFKSKYQQIAGAFPEVEIDYYYVTKSDEDPNDDAVKAMERLKLKVGSHLSGAKCEFHFVNASKLWTQVQKRAPKSKTLTWHAAPLETPEGWLGLVKLQDYREFLKDERGDLEERIFESNVRGFQQNTPVNVDIRKTLDAAGKTDFWLLNNGITILTPRADSAGYQKLKIEDPQIVNGLQTSRQIDAYFRAGVNIPPAEKDERRILVRVLKSSDEEVRDNVIRATNSQNKMPAEALRATDRIHGQIETLFKKYELYYDRRKGQHKDEGKPIAQIISVIELVQAMLATVIRRPDAARARPRDFIKNDESYAEIFGEDRLDLSMYLKCVLLHRRTVEFLADDARKLDYAHQRNLKFYLTWYVAASLVENVFIPAADLRKVEIGKVTDSFIADCYARLWKKYEQLAKKHAVDGESDYDSLAKGPLLLKALTSDLKRRFSKKKA